MNHSELIKHLTPLHGAGEARAIVRMVMEERFGVSQTDLLLGKDTTLSSRDRTEFEKIASRLLKGEPVQHILGYADFCGYRFRVTPDVLIPRPETEEMTRWAMDTLSTLAASVSDVSPSGCTRLSILDLCTGTGCIAISLSLAFPEASVTAIDISPSALAVARDNANALGATNVRFLQQDILKAAMPVGSALASVSVGSALATMPVASAAGLSAGHSLLISNPPYVRTTEAAMMSPTVLDHEPSLALFVPDDDPLIFYRAIARIGLSALVPGGFVMTELNAAFAEATRSLFAEAGYEHTIIREDQFGRPRFLLAQRLQN